MKRKLKVIAPLSIYSEVRSREEFDVYAFDRIASHEVQVVVRSLFNRRGPSRVKADSIKFALEGEIDKLIRFLAK